MTEEEILSKYNSVNEFKLYLFEVMTNESFSRANVLIAPHKVANAHRGNIYTEEENVSIINEDKRISKLCRDEFYRVKALMDAKTNVIEILDAFNSRNFAGIS